MFPFQSCSEWGLHCHLSYHRCGELLPRLSILTAKRRFISVALSLESPPPDVIRHPALWSSDFPHRDAVRPLVLLNSVSSNYPVLLCNSVRIPACCRLWQQAACQKIAVLRIGLLSLGRSASFLRYQYPTAVFADHNAVASCRDRVYDNGGEGHMAAAGVAVKPCDRVGD